MKGEVYGLKDLIVFEEDHYELIKIAGYDKIRFREDNYSMFVKFLMELPYIHKFRKIHENMFMLHDMELVDDLYVHLKPIYDKYRNPTSEDGYLQEGLDITIGNPDNNFNLKFFYMVLWSNICYQIYTEIEVINKRKLVDRKPNPLRLTHWDFVHFDPDVVGVSKVFTYQIKKFWNGSNLFRGGWDLPAYKEYQTEIGRYPADWHVPKELTSQYFDKILLRVGCNNVKDVMDVVLSDKSHRVSMSDCSDIFGFSFRESVSRIVRFSKRRVGDYMQYELKDGLYMYRRMDLLFLSMYLRHIIIRNGCWVKAWQGMGI